MTTETLTAASAGNRTSGVWHLGGVAGIDGGIDGPAELVVDGGVITVLRPAPAAGPVGADDPWLVAVPLPVNAHDHGRGSGNVLAGIPDAPLEAWITSLRAARSTQAALVGDGCRSMLGAGVGATVLCVNPQQPDIAAEVAAAIDEVRALGLRAAVVYPIADANDAVEGRSRDAAGWSPTVLRRHLDAVERLADGLTDFTIDVQLGPVGPQWVSETTLAAVGAAARRSGRRVHMHLLESPVQRRWADRTYPEGIVELLRRCDLLGDHVCVAHGTHLRPAELEALAASGTVLSINVSSNLRLASGIPPAAEARRLGVSFGAGLDGLALGDDADYWNELRLLRGVTQAQTGATVDAASLLGPLSAAGGRALGLAAPAPVAVGNTADLVLLDLRGHRHLAERHGWSAADIVLAAGRPDRVAEVWVAGRAVGPGRFHSSISGGSR